MAKTRTFELNKLVRDDIVQQHLDAGAKVEYKKLEADEKLQALVEKIKEELDEFLSSRDPSELADAVEALAQIAMDAGVSTEQIESARDKKCAKNGGFKQGLYIEAETWPADHHWAEYYAADPERFPEVKDN